MINNELAPSRTYVTPTSLQLIKIFSASFTRSIYRGIDFPASGRGIYYTRYIFQCIYDSRMSSRCPSYSSFLSCAVASLKNLYSSDLASTINQLNTLHSRLRRNETSIIDPCERMDIGKIHSDIYDDISLRASLSINSVQRVD